MMYQVGVFYNKVLNEEEKFRLCDNIASHLCNAQPFIQVSSARVPNSLRGTPGPLVHQIDNVIFPKSVGVDPSKAQ